MTINSNYTAAGPITSDKSVPRPRNSAFNGNITAATSLTVNGGTVTLGGANTFTGDNTVNGGTLGVSGASATFGGGNLNVKAGHAAIAAGVLNAIADTATLTLAGGGTADMADTGYIDLAAGINEHVASLVLGTTSSPAGHSVPWEAVLQISWTNISPAWALSLSWLRPCPATITTTAKWTPATT